jgi:hypothetical protein
MILEAKMLRSTFILSAILATAAVQAQQAVQPPDAGINTSLISDKTVRNVDSPLVQAAKRALASRQKISGTVIDNDMVSRSHYTLSTSTYLGDLPSAGGQALGPAQDTSAPYVDVPALKAKSAALTREAQTMRAAEEEGPYQDGTEDLAQRRLNEIPKQLQDINQQLQQAQPSMSQPGQQPSQSQPARSQTPQSQSTSYPQ